VSLPDCPACSRLIRNDVIRSPDDLRECLIALQLALGEGRVTQVGDREEPVLDMLPNGPWPDFIEATIRCRACGMTYSLTVETFHGSGGRWRRSQ